MRGIPRRLGLGLLLAAGVLAVACSSARLYYLDTELPVVGGKRRLVVGFGPWPSVPAVLANMDSVPDDLVLPTLRALMELPGASDSWARMAFRSPMPPSTASESKHWEFQAVCEPQRSSGIHRGKPIPPECSPELLD